MFWRETKVAAHHTDAVEGFEVLAVLELRVSVYKERVEIRYTEPQPWDLIEEYIGRAILQFECFGDNEHLATFLGLRRVEFVRPTVEMLSQLGLVMVSESGVIPTTELSAAVEEHAWPRMRTQELEIEYIPSLRRRTTTLSYAAFRIATIGKDLHVVISRRMGTDPRSRRIVYLGAHQAYAELDDLMERFNISCCVVDAMPEIHATRAFANRHPGKTWLCFFNEHQKGEPKWVRAKQIVQVNRTEAMDESRSVIRDRKLILPRRIPVVEEFASHVAANAKRLEEDKETGEQRYKVDPDGARPLLSRPDLRLPGFDARLGPATVFQRGRSRGRDVDLRQAILRCANRPEYAASDPAAGAFNGQGSSRRGRLMGRGSTGRGV